MAEDRKRKGKSYYVRSKKPRNEFHLEAGMKGFLITCNRNEKQAVAEAYRLFDEYYDVIYGKTNEQKVEDEDDIKSSAMNYSCDSFNNKRFQNVDTKTKNVIFIRTTVDYPDKIVQKIFVDSLCTGIVKSKSILRLMPILGTCKADEEKIEKLSEEVICNYFKENNFISLTYCIICKIRNNNNMNKDSIYSIIGKALRTLNIEVKVNFDNPNLVICIDVLQKVCCMTILPDYFKFKKYNIHEFGSNKKEELNNEVVKTDE